MNRMTRKDFRWLAEEIAPMIYQNDMKDFAKAVKSYSRNSRFDMDKFLDVSKLSWEGRNSPQAQDDWLSNDLDKQYQEGKRNGSISKAA
jgi:hypothetical protein